MSHKADHISLIIAIAVSIPTHDLQLQTEYLLAELNYQ